MSPHLRGDSVTMATIGRRQIGLCHPFFKGFVEQPMINVGKLSGKYQQ